MFVLVRDVIAERPSAAVCQARSEDAAPRNESWAARNHQNIFGDETTVE